MAGVTPPAAPLAAYLVTKHEHDVINCGARVVHAQRLQQGVRVSASSTSA